MTSISTINADRSVLNIASGNQTNYNIYPPPVTGILTSSFMCIREPKRRGLSCLVFHSELTYTHSEQANSTRSPVINASVDILSVNFTGRRKELIFLQTALSKFHRGVPSRCAVYGMPGIGKTQLLLRYAKVSWDQQQYSCIVWISATSVDKINQGISCILDLIEHPDRYLQDQTAKLMAARVWLEKYEGGDWLLVFDNVQKETLGFLRVHLPLTNDRGNILFSTRTADVAESLVNAAGERYQILGLQAMGLQDTADLLFADAGIGAEMATPSLFSQAEDLVKRVGRLPLAVVQAASFMKQTHTTLDHMLELYKKERKMEASLFYQRLLCCTYSQP
jgi:hypothetical protein